MNRLGLIFLILIPFVATQSCDSRNYNSTCTSASSKRGVCCDDRGVYNCYAGYDKCCGYDSLCQAGYDCCPGAYGYKSYCLIGYKCCNAGYSNLFICEPGQECCGNKCCSQALAGWFIAVIVVGALVIIGAIAFCIYKRRQSRMNMMRL